jgi:hypothetical protein
MNTAMAQMPEFLGTGLGTVKESEDDPDADAVLTQFAVGGGPAGGDFWQLTMLEFNVPSLEQSYFTQDRVVDGVAYSQDVDTGVWEIVEDADPNPVEEAFAGRLDLADIVVERTSTGWTLTGTYPADPTVDLVSVDLDGVNGRLLRVAMQSRLPRSEFAGLVGSGPDLVLAQRVDVTTYALDVGPITAPPVGTATVLIPDPEAPFLVSIPADWEQFPIEELDASGFTDGYIGPRGIGLLVLLEDLTGTGITNLGGYADAVQTNALVDFNITYSDSINTLQGGFAWLISGTDPTDGAAFRRLLYVTPDGIAVNLTFVQGLDPETGLLTEAWDESQGLIDFMLNSFMVDL